MNEKITFPALIQLFAIQSGFSRKQSEDFLKEFFSLISAALEAGEQVKIKDFGVFKTVKVDARKSVNVSTGEDHEIPAHRKVVFVPSKEMAAIINQPFEAFETVELAEETILEPEPDALADDGQEEDVEIIPSQPETAESSEVEEEPEAGEEEIEAGEEDLNVYTYDAEDDESLGNEAVEQEQPSEQSEEEVAEQPEDRPAEETVVNEEPQPLITDIEEIDVSATKEPEASDSQPKSEVVESVEEEGNEEIAVAEPSVTETVDRQPHAEQEEPLLMPDDAPVTNERERKPRFWLGFLFGVLTMILVGCVIYIIRDSLQQEDADAKETSFLAADVTASESQTAEVSLPVTDTEEVTEDIAEEEVEVAPTKVSDPAPVASKPVYDVISKTRYLTTMAKDHYGNYHLWPYIYEENKSFLGHPDRIKPGTRVVIPDLKKYGVNPQNPADIDKAKRKGVEIYSRYK